MLYRYEYRIEDWGFGLMSQTQRPDNVVIYPPGWEIKHIMHSGSFGAYVILRRRVWFWQKPTVASKVERKIVSRERARA